MQLLEEHDPYNIDKIKIQRLVRRELSLPSIVSVSKKLSHELLNLDIDEGVRVESTKSGIRMYINKRTSGCYVLEICSQLTDKSEIGFYRNINHIHKLIDKIFGKEYYVSLY